MPFALQKRHLEGPEPSPEPEVDLPSPEPATELGGRRGPGGPGGQKFFKNQFTLPHFESPRNATIGLPAEAEKYIDADQVESVQGRGSFRHGITVHKMECDVLHIRLRDKAAKAAPIDKGGKFESKWVKREKLSQTFANSFSLKALEFLG